MPGPRPIISLLGHPPHSHPLSKIYKRQMWSDHSAFKDFRASHCPKYQAQAAQPETNDPGYVTWSQPGQPRLLLLPAPTSGSFCTPYQLCAFCSFWSGVPFPSPFPPRPAFSHHLRLSSHNSPLPGSSPDSPADMPFIWPRDTNHTCQYVCLQVVLHQVCSERLKGKNHSRAISESWRLTQKDAQEVFNNKWLNGWTDDGGRMDGWMSGWIDG